MDDIDNYVRQSNRTLSTYSTFNAASDVLILQIQSVNAASQLVAGKYDYVVYSLTGSNFNRQIFPDPASARVAVTKRLANKVVSLTFTYSDPAYPLVKQVNTSITITESVGFQSRTINISSQSKLRNY